jgi:integrase/recombinase XerD
VLDIQAKRTTTTIISYLTSAELDVLLTAPDRTTWHGRRDHALLVLAAQTGLRVSKLTELTIDDVHLGTGAHLYCRGKGRKDRCTPVTTHTAGVLTEWLAERHTPRTAPVFCTHAGTPMSSDAISRLTSKYATMAALACPSIAAKKSLRTPSGTPPR